MERVSDPDSNMILLRYIGADGREAEIDSVESFKAAIASGEISDNTLVRMSDQVRWLPAIDHIEFMTLKRQHDASEALGKSGTGDSTALGAEPSQDEEQSDRPGAKESGKNGGPSLRGERPGKPASLGADAVRQGNGPRLGALPGSQVKDESPSIVLRPTFPSSDAAPLETLGGPSDRPKLGPATPPPLGTSAGSGPAGQKADNGAQPSIERNEPTLERRETDQRSPRITVDALRPVPPLDTGAERGAERTPTPDTPSPDATADRAAGTTVPPAQDEAPRGTVRAEGTRASVIAEPFTPIPLDAPETAGTPGQGDDQGAAISGQKIFLPGEIRVIESGLRSYLGTAWIFALLAAVPFGALCYQLFGGFSPVESMVAFGWGRFSLGALVSADQLALGSIAGYVLPLVAFVAAFLALYKARVLAEDLLIFGFRYSFYWTFVSLFVPLINLYRPWFGIGELDRSLVNSARSGEIGSGWRRGFSAWTVLLAVTLLGTIIAIVAIYRAYPVALAAESAVWQLATMELVVWGLFLVVPFLFMMRLRRAIDSILDEVARPRTSYT